MCITIFVTMGRFHGAVVLICVIMLGMILDCQTSDSSFSMDQVSDTERYRLGKEQYETIKREGRMPRYSKCWTSALQNLEFGCKNLDDDVQHRLGLAFTNCFLQKTGKKPYPCESHQDIRICTKDMVPEAYNVYTEFFTHTQNICFFLQAQVWQELTEDTVARLADNSHRVSEQIENSSSLQAEVMKRQNESIKNQELLLQRGKQLKHALESSSMDVHRMLQEFKDTTSEQRAMIFEVFDRVASLQSVVMGEFTGFYSLIFYVISILVSYLLTSTPRTSAARFWLFVIMSLNIIAERILVAWGVDEDMPGGNILDLNTIIYGRLWLCRKIFCVCALVLWLVFAYRFMDYNKINNQLLVEIRKQNSDLKRFILDAGYHVGTPNGSVNPTPTSTPPVALLVDEGSNHGNNTVCKISKASMGASPIGSGLQSLGSLSDSSLEESHPGQNVSDTFRGYETDESDSSSDSGESDHTFNIDEHQESDAESFVSTFSREGTPVLLEELHDLRQATPLREMTPSLSAGCGSHLNFLVPSGSSPPRKGQGKRPIPAPLLLSERPGISRYNLRKRSTSQSPTNPTVQSESPRSFGKLVKDLAKTAIRNRINTRLTVERLKNQSGNAKARAFFSSDED